MTDPVFSAETLKSVIDSENQAKAGALDRSASIAVRTNPDEFARYNTLAKQTGLDPFGLMQNKEAANEAERRVKFNGFVGLEDSPHSAAFLSDPKNAALMQDDGESMTAIEQVGRKMGAFTGGAAEGVGMLLHGTGRLYDISARALAAPLIAVGGKPVEDFLLTPIPEWASPSATFLKKPGAGLKQAGASLKPTSPTFADDVFSGLGQVASQIAMYLATGGAAASVGMLAQGADVVGDKTDKDVAPQANKDMAMLLGGTATSVTEKFALDKILGPMAVPIKNQIGAALARIGIAGAAEGTQEFSENVIHDALRKAFTKPDAEIGIDESLYEGGVGAAVGGIVRSIVEAGLHIKDRGERSTERAEGYAMTLSDAMRAIATSKTKTRDASTMQAFVQSVADANNGDQPATLFISPVAMEEALNQGNVSIDLLPSVSAQIEEAKRSGGDLEIPTGELLTAFAGTGAEQQIVQHIRSEPNAPTLAEVQEDAGKAAEFLRAEADKIASQYDANTQWDASGKEVEDFVSQQLQLTGMRAQDAQADGQLHRHVFTVLADKYTRSGKPMLPMDVFKQHGLRVIGKEVAGGNVMAQGVGAGETEATPEEGSAVQATDDATGLPLNRDGTVTVYHHTSAKNAEQIRQTGKIKAYAEPDVYVTTRQETDTGYGDTAVPIRINPELLSIDDEFPGGRKDFRINVGKPGGSIDVTIPSDQNILKQSQSETFYSQLTSSIESAPDKVFTSGKAISQWLTSNAPKLGIKADEIQWTGITDWLDLKGKEKVSKDDVLEYLKDGGVRVEENTLGDRGGWVVTWSSGDKTNFETEQDAQNALNAQVEEEREMADQADVEFDEDIVGSIERATSEETGTKFSTYVPPGGKPGTYRELLLTLPERKPIPTVQESRRQELEGLNNQAKISKKEFAELLELRKTTPLANERVNFTSSHFDQTNIVSHLRVDEVEGANGERLLRVVEAQSDWGQQGRKNGFKRDPAPIEKVISEKYGEKLPSDVYDWSAKKLEAAGVDGELIADWSDALKKSGRVPVAPFITDTGAWLSLALKKAINYAAENGMDGVVFATGQQNADLYDLSKQVDSVSWTDWPSAGENHGVLVATKDGAQVMKQTIPASEIEDHVGKEVARKLMDQQEDIGGRKILEGEDLSVGGIGMRDFYDRIVPQTAKKVLRQIGADAKVESIDVGAMQPGFMLTDELRAKAMQGLPLFQGSGTPRATFNPSTAYEIKDAAGNSLGFATGNDPDSALSSFNTTNNTDAGKSADQVPLITLLADANLSSFLHESGHFFLSVYADIAIQPDGPAEVKQDMEELLKWFGIEGTETVGIGARGGEFEQSKVGAGMTSVSQQIQDAAIDAARQVQDESNDADIAEEVRSIEANGDIDLSMLIEDSKYWDSENEEFNAAGIDEYNRLKLEKAKENLRLTDITEMSDLDRAFHKAQYAAMKAILDGIGIEYTDTSSAQSKYLEVLGVKLRFADHANQVRDTSIRGSLPVVNVAPGESTFTEALNTVLQKFSTITKGGEFEQANRLQPTPDSSPYRDSFPKVRGGWTKDKIRKVLKETKGGSGKLIHREIAKFDSPEEFSDHIFYHGTGGSVSNSLKPSITMSERDAERIGGGGYGERYWAISVTKNKNTAQIFTGQSRYGTVYPVVLKKGAKVISRSDISDSVELEDIIEELWDQGVDAVKIGKWDAEHTEQELAVLNPKAIFKYDASESFQVFNMQLLPVPTKEQIAETYQKAISIIPHLDAIKGMPRAAWDEAFSKLDHKLLFQQSEQTDMPEANPPLGRTRLETWNMMTLDEQRPYHERFAETFEQYLFTGKAPSLELQPLFRRFASWMKRVYQSVQNFIGINKLAKLDQAISSIFDRMLATDKEIEAAKAARNYVNLFKTAEEGGMTPDEWADYQATNSEQAEVAAEELTARALRELKWSRNLHGRIVSELQKEAKAARSVARMDARKSVMTQPVYQAWQFLTGRMPKKGGVKPKPLAADIVRPETDPMFAAIGRLGGIDRQQLQSEWGIDPKEKIASGVFGKPAARKTNGRSIDEMAEALSQYGYLTLDENGKWDLSEFEDLFKQELGGTPHYSNQFDYDALKEDGEPIEVESSGRLFDPFIDGYYSGTEIATKLRALKMTTADDTGFHPDVVAEAFGFDSGDAMVREIVESPTPNEAIEAETDRLMMERYSELATPEAISQAADEAIHNEVSAKMAATELLRLRKGLGNVPSLMKAAKEYAAELIGRKAIKDVKPHVFAAAEARASKAAMKALAKGDQEQAAKDKRAHVLNNAAAREAYAVLKEIKTGMDFFKLVMKGGTERVSKTRDPDVVMAARALLADYGIGEKQKRKANAYLEAVKEYDPAMYSMLADRMANAQANAKDYRTLTVDEFRMLKDEIYAMWHLAKRSKEMEVDGNLMDIQDAEDEIMNRLEEIGIPKRIPGEGYAVTEAEKKGLMYHAAGAFLRRVESWVGGMDGSEMGPFRKLVWSQIRDAADNYRADKADKLAQFRSLVDGIAPTLLPIEIAAPELGYTFGKGKGGMGMVELLHAILHAGNDSNKRKLLLGRGWGSLNDDGTLNTARWDAFISRMIREGRIQKQHYDFAQGVWDLLESMKPLAQKVHRDVFGRYFDEVTANPVLTPFGTYRGGYVPAIADPDITADAKTRAMAESENSSLVSAFPSTPKGWAKSRTEYNKPLMLDLRSLTQHIDKVLLFSHLEQPVRDVRKLLTRTKVSTALHRISPAAFDSMLTPWLNRTAQQVVETPIVGSGGWMRIFSKLRARSGMVAMFGNVANSVQQATGMSLAAVKVKPKYLMEASAQFMRHPAKMSELVSEMSPYMANRMEHEISMLSEEINAVLLNPTALESAQAWSQRHAYFLQTGVDNVISPIVWVGAYNQALETADKSMSDEALKLYARRLADSSVRETQGTMMPEDVARIETGNSFVRMFTQFAGYFNMNANLLGTEFIKLTRDIGLKNGAGRGLYVLLFGLLIPAWVGEAIMQAFRGGPDDEDKDGEYLDDWMAAVFGFGLLRYATAMVPGVGQTINMMANRFNSKPYDDRMSTAPAVSMIESAATAPFSVYQSIVDDGKPSKSIRDVSTLVGLTLGVPLTPATKAIGYVADVQADRVDPTSNIDAVRGTITGVASPESKQ